MAKIQWAGLKKILCVGAHSDDIEIGMGGTLLKLIRQTPDLEVCWVVFSGPGTRADEARRSAEDFLAGVKNKHIKVGPFRVSYFPNEWAKVKDWFEEVKSEFDPEVVFTHYREDRHQDHRVLGELAWNTFRNHLVLEYEIPKYDGDLGAPNVFVPLADEVSLEKVRLVTKHFQTQANKHWFSDDLFLALMRIRGMECTSRYAEAFYGRKVVIE
jgi:LmbE family N-acetylglucosaminyl deacetylase